MIPAFGIVYLRRLSDMNIRKKSGAVAVQFNVEYDEIQWENNWIPKTVYKYRDWSNEFHRQILEQCAIYVPDCLNFNDPYDCNIPVRYDLLATDDKLAEDYFKIFIARGNKKGTNDIKAEVASLMAMGKHKNVEFLQSMTKDILEKNKKMHGILSVTPINNNILMWSHYANSHKGFCVGFDSQILFKFLGGGGPIHYSHNIPIIGPNESREVQHFKQVHTKSNHWEYEMEYRLITFGRVNTNISIPANAISEIILGAKISEEHKQQITELVRKKYPTAAIYQCVTSDKTFSVDLHRIQ